MQPISYNLIIHFLNSNRFYRADYILENLASWTAIPVMVTYNLTENKYSRYLVWTQQTQSALVISMTASAKRRAFIRRIYRIIFHIPRHKKWFQTIAMPYISAYCTRLWIQANLNKANLTDLIAANGLIILLTLDSNNRFLRPCDFEIWWMTR